MWVQFEDLIKGKVFYFEKQNLIRINKKIDHIRVDMAKERTLRIRLIANKAMFVSVYVREMRILHPYLMRAQLDSI